MEPFATVEDLEARWRELNEDERGCAAALLSDASAFLAAEFNRLGRVIDREDDLQIANLKRICCSIVSRSFPDDTDGIAQFSVTTGPFTKSQTMSNPARDFYLTKQERLTLDLPQQTVRIGLVMPKGCEDD